MKAKEVFMKEAIRLAGENNVTGNGGPFGAVIVKDGEIIARGHNEVTSTNDPTAHAEIVAIRNACRNLSSFQLEGCEIYASCEPCPMCLGAIYWARPSKIYFAATREDAARAGFDDSRIYEEISLDYNRRIIPCEQIMHEESLHVFHSWIENGNKILY